MKQLIVFLVPRIIAFCLLTFAVSCGGAVPTISPSSIIPSATETSIPVATSTVALPPPTSPATAIVMPTQTHAPTPTLPPDEAQALLLDLLQNNAGCRLPCWWGFTPGRTSWQVAESYLSTFAFAIKRGSSVERPLYSVYFIVPEEIFPVALIHNYKVIDGSIQRIEVILGSVPTYNLSAFLSTYGMPSEVWLRTYNQAREGDLPFDTVLFYPEQGILTRYDSQADDLGEQITGCPQQKPALVLSLWSPERQLTFAEATSETIEIREDGWLYHPLQEATGMDVETFYQTFKEANNSVCLETPAGLWPSP